MKRALAVAFVSLAMLSSGCSKRSAAAVEKPVEQAAVAKQPAIQQSIAVHEAPQTAAVQPAPTTLHIGVEPKREPEPDLLNAKPQTTEAQLANPCAGHGRVAGTVKFDGAVQYVCSDNSVQAAAAAANGPCDQMTMSNAASVWAAYDNPDDPMARLRAEQYVARARDCQQQRWQKALEQRH